MRLNHHFQSNVIFKFPDPKETEEWRIRRLPRDLRGPEPYVRELQDLQPARLQTLQRRMQTPKSSQAEAR